MSVLVSGRSTQHLEAKALHELGVRNHGWYMTEAEHRGVLEVIERLEAEIERLRDRAVCSGCGSDVNEAGVCTYPGCDDGEMIPASDLPVALREMRDRRDEWMQEAMET